VGLETQNGITVHHIQFWNSFTSNPPLASLSSFSQRDIWIDATSNLGANLVQRSPSLKEQPRDGGRCHLCEFYKLESVLYPTTIQKSMNGTPWATIAITNVSFNTGLTDANFPVN
jgi:hypothetical protein